MPGKIFINYRRDDAPAVAARIRDRLAGLFGASNVFMDVDNLLAGQRFDKELRRALIQTDVFLAIIGSKWQDLLSRRQTSKERDFVRQEIAEALKRNVVVIPVLVDRAQMPRGDTLPQDIRELVLHQKHDVSHEHFGRDFDELVIAINACSAMQANAPADPAQRPGAHRSIPWGWTAFFALASLVVGFLIAQQFDHRIFSSQSPRTSVPVAGSVGRDDLRRMTSEVEGYRSRATVADAQVVTPLGPLRSGQMFRDCATDCPELVVVPAGAFVMGSPPDERDRDKDEGPQRKVKISQPFAVGKYEVTFAEWEACAAGGGCTGNPSPSDQGWGKGRRPVINVSWHDAKAYVDWLSRRTGKPYRLLSEAEWEYAARAGTATRFSVGGSISRNDAHFQNGSASSVVGTVEVGMFPANAFGLHDMHGNVSEWVEDSGHSSYRDAPTDGSAWIDGSSTRVLRGGSWNDPPRGLRSAFRLRDRPNYSVGIVGFRVARDL
jgi:formylglycine-generating enzyme required for sulfatase activity